MDNRSRQEGVCERVCLCKDVLHMGMSGIVNRTCFHCLTATCGKATLGHSPQWALSRLFPLLLRSTPLTSIDTLAYYSMKQMALQMLWSYGEQRCFLLWRVLTCTNTGRVSLKSSVVTSHTNWTQKASVLRQLTSKTNVWTCLCFISEHSKVELLWSMLPLGTHAHLIALETG